WSKSSGRFQSKRNLGSRRTCRRQRAYALTAITGYDWSCPAFSRSPPAGSETISVTHGQDHRYYATRFVGRRRLLQLGRLCCLGLNLSGLFRAEEARAARLAATPTTARIKSCILLYYYGGPSHLDTWDMKPNAPREIRGEFQSIATKVPGVRISEHL